MNKLIFTTGIESRGFLDAAFRRCRRYSKGKRKTNVLVEAWDAPPYCLLEAENKGKKCKARREDA